MWNTFLILLCPAEIGYCRPRTLPHNNIVILSWRARDYPRCVTTLLQFDIRTLQDSANLFDACLRTVYDVSNRESFDALPRWFSELETYVSSSVVKIIVGNKVDKVCLSSSLPVFCFSSLLCLKNYTHTTPLVFPLQEYSRQVPTAEAEQFAARQNCLFVEASAKTSVGVRDAFRNVVAQILDTPELWDSAGSKAVAKSSSKGGAGSGAERTMPGNIDLRDEGGAGEGAEGGCMC